MTVEPQLSTFPERQASAKNGQKHAIYDCGGNTATVWKDGLGLGERQASPRSYLRVKGTCYTCEERPLSPANEYTGINIHCSSFSQVLDPVGMASFKHALSSLTG